MSQIAIVESAVDLKSIERQVQRAKVALDDADRLVDATGKKHESAVEAQRQARVDLGRWLAEARKGHATRGPKAKTWGEFLMSCGLTQQTAHNYMRLAGYSDEVSPTHDDVGETAPTFRDAGIDKRPRKAEAKGSLAERKRDEQPDPVPEPDIVPIRLPARDLDRALMSIHKTMMGYAKTWPSRSRVELAKTLRDLASEIEQMTDGGED